MPTNGSPNVPRQLHIRLSVSDARKLKKLARRGKLSVSDAVRALIRSTASIVSATPIKES